MEQADLSAREVADRLKMNFDFIRRLCRRGRLPGAYRADSNGAWTVPAKAFRAYRRARAVLKGTGTGPNRANSQQVTQKTHGDITRSDN